MENLIDRDQAEVIRSMMGKLNLWRKKEEVVKESSLNNCTRIHELTKLEATRMIADLQKQLDKSNNMRRALLSMGYQLHWDQPRSNAEREMDPKRVNFNHVNDFFCRDPRSKIKKSINHMNPQELNQAVQQLQSIVDHVKKQKANA
jgi:hypothetical protein